MITISTCIEPAPVNPVVSEPPKPREVEEEPDDSFAELLAGMLSKTGTESETDVLDDVSAVEAGVDIFAEESLFERKSVKLSGIENGAAEKELSEIEIPDEQLSVLFSAERLLFSLDESNAIEETADEFSPDLAGINLTDDQAWMMEENAGGFSAFAELAETPAAAQSFAEALAAENGKKERALKKSENTEISSASKESKSDDLLALRKGQEKENPGRLEEARSRSRRERVNFDVRDMRTVSDSANNTQSRLAGADVTTARVQPDSPREITLELRLPENHNGAAGQTAQTTWEAKASNAFESMLSRELHQNLNNDIVRHASIALRDGGESTIRLALKPESLGNVKIHLKMTENKITGQIVVDSEEALNAFRKEIASLEQAFKDSGFENADLNLSLTADGRNTQGREQETFVPQAIASRYEQSSNNFEELDSQVEVHFGRMHGAVDMIA